MSHSTLQLHSSRNEQLIRDIENFTESIKPVSTDKLQFLKKQYLDYVTSELIKQKQRSKHNDEDGNGGKENTTLTFSADLDLLKIPQTISAHPTASGSVHTAASGESTVDNNECTTNNHGPALTSSGPTVSAPVAVLYPHDSTSDGDSTSLPEEQLRASPPFELSPSPIASPLRTEISHVPQSSCPVTTLPLAIDNPVTIDETKGSLSVEDNEQDANKPPSLSGGTTADHLSAIQSISSVDSPVGSKGDVESESELAHPSSPSPHQEQNDSSDHLYIEPITKDEGHQTHTTLTGTRQHEPDNDALHLSPSSDSEEFWENSSIGPALSDENKDNEHGSLSSSSSINGAFAVTDSPAYQSMVQSSVISDDDSIISKDSVADAIELELSKPVKTTAKQLSSVNSSSLDDDDDSFSSMSAALKYVPSAVQRNSSNYTSAQSLTGGTDLLESGQELEQAVDDFDFYT